MSSNYLCNRREIAAIGSAAFFSIAVPKCSNAVFTQSPVPNPVAELCNNMPLNLDDALKLISTHGAKMIDAVQEAEGSFLYRGEQFSKGQPFLSVQPPDLLDSSTYNSNVAVEYFKMADEMLINLYDAGATPSTAHIMVGDANSAAKWGEPCSVWPIGTDLEWTWLEHTFEFWDSGWEKPDSGGSLQNGNREAFFWRQTGALKEYFDAGVIVDRDLPEAIRSGHEIFVSSGPLQLNFGTNRGKIVRNAFVAIPATFDTEVRKKLGISYVPRKNSRDIFGSNEEQSKWIFSPKGRTFTVIE